MKRREFIMGLAVAALRCAPLCSTFKGRNGMKMLAAIKLGLLALVLLSGELTAYAQESGDPVEGLAVARAQCGTCHAVFKGVESSPRLEAPPFDTIAAVPGMTAIALTVALQSSHATMPMIILTPDDRRNVVAYILSLKPR
jgi:mono/diheme cytochrome c family protein